MASTYSPILRTELPALGEQAGTWNTTINNDIGTFLEAAIAGTATHNTAGAADTTLTALNGTADEARNAVIKLTGVLTGSHNVICPSVSKQYLVINATTGAFSVTFKTAAGTGVVVPQGSYMFLYCDGTNVLNPMTGSQLVTPNIGVATGTSLNLSGNFAVNTNKFTVDATTGNAAVAGTLTIGGVAEVPFPSGTRMLFNQTAAPTGWTKDTTAALDDTALRIVTGTVGSGGSTAFSTAAYTPTITVSSTLAVASHTLTLAEIPAHSHVQQLSSVYVFPDNTTSTGNAIPPFTLGTATAQQPLSTQNSGSGGGHTHNLTGSTSATSSTVTLSLKYNDVIIASKN